VLAVALLLATLCPSQAADPEPKRVMILHSVGREFRPWNTYAKDIRAELDRQSRWPVDVQEHSLVSARSGDPRADALFLDYIRALYAGAPPDLIISVGAPSAGFLQRHRQELFPSTPILFTVLEQRRVQYSSLTENDTVVAIRHDFLVLFESFLQIAPDTKVIAIINGKADITIQGRQVRLGPEAGIGRRSGDVDRRLAILRRCGKISSGRTVAAVRT
jgi:hypothetical protein